MSNFRDSLKMKVSDLVEKLEERMYQIYDHHNKLIQEKLQEFSEKMEKINNLETELKQVCHTVETVYKDLCYFITIIYNLFHHTIDVGKSPQFPVLYYHKKSCYAYFVCIYPFPFFF
uniref:Synaptonemal complex central element protein 2 n=1 Tax=Monodelphis domestica TaxID=13616 RepID=A0A5F8GWI5_MONDO